MGWKLTEAKSNFCLDSIHESISHLSLLYPSPLPLPPRYKESKEQKELAKIIAIISHCVGCLLKLYVLLQLISKLFHCPAVNQTVLTKKKLNK